MCRLLVMGLYVRNTSCCISLSKKYVMRYASSKHLWAGSQAFMEIEGISHFNNESEVDRLARSFLNDDAVLDKQPNRYEFYRSNKNSEHSFVQTDYKIRHLKEPNESIQELSNRDGKFQMDNSDKTDKREVNVKTNTETSKLNYSTNHSFADFAKLENFVKLSNDAVVENAHHDAKKVFNSSEISMKNLNITLRGAHKNSTLGAIEFNPEMISTELQNLGAANTEQGQNSSSKSDETTYKHFQTIEVPIPDYNPASMSKENNLAEGQTVLNETKSRILIRYALLKALYILESGGSHCKAKIVFRTTDKAKGSQK